MQGGARSPIHDRDRVAVERASCAWRISMKIEYIPVRQLRPYPKNARTHSRKQIQQIANSIKKFGFCNPVLIDDAKQIIAGHGRVEAAKQLGIDAVPTCRLSHLSDADKRAYVLADNKLAEKAGWDRELWRLELLGAIIDRNHVLIRLPPSLPRMEFSGETEVLRTRNAHRRFVYFRHTQAICW